MTYFRCPKPFKMNSILPAIWQQRAQASPQGRIQDYSSEPLIDGSTRRPMQITAIRMLGPGCVTIGYASCISCCFPAASIRLSLLLSYIFFQYFICLYFGWGGEGWEFLWININKNIINLSRFNASIGSGFWFLCHVTIIISFYFLMGRFFLSF